MRKKINLLDEEIEYALRVSSRARYVRLSVSNEGRVTLTVPRFVSFVAAERFLRGKAQWLWEKLGAVAAHHVRSREEMRAEYLAYKDRALILAQSRAAQYAAAYGVSYGAVAIRNQRTCWGSCTKRGNLSFNYKVALLPEHLADYVIVHEICHLKHMNHSTKFWNLVAKAVPDHAARRKELRRIGLA